jgi:Tfp pilus assembly protein PilF
MPGRSTDHRGAAVITEAPEYITARLTLGAAYQMQARLDDAAAVYAEALRVDPQSHDAHFDLAKLCNSRNDTGSAIEHYRAAIAQRPSSAMAHINLATVLYTMGDLSGARQYFESGLEAFSDSTVGHFNFGMFLADQGELAAP